MTKIGVTGHQSIPQMATEFIRRGFMDELCLESSSENSLVGFTSLAAGADQMFAELVLAVGGQLHVVIPSARYESTFDRNAVRKYRQLLKQAMDVERLEYPEPSDEAFWAAGRLIVEQVDRLLAVWDGCPSRGLGGTADVVRYAHECGRDVKVIWPAGVVR